MRTSWSVWKSRVHQAGRKLWQSDTGISILIGLLVVLGLTATADQGYVRDEGYYFKAAREYHAWFEELWRNLWAGRLGESFSTATLSRAFGYNTEHPGFVKLLMGWSWKLFHEWLGVVGDATGYRLGSILMNGVGAAFTYLLGVRVWNRSVGVLGVALLFACPHVYYHSHLACFDGPITAMTVVVTYAFLRSLQSWRWVIATGLLWGVAVATKHNALFLIPTLLLAYGLSRLAEFRWTPQWRLSLPAVPLAIFAIAVLGPLVFFVTYPYGWPAPMSRIGAYYSYHLHHEHYPVDYFGTLYTEPPFPVSFPFVMSAITVPLVVLLPGIVGWLLVSWRALRALVLAFKTRTEMSEAGSAAWLLTVSAFIPPAIIAEPSVPIFGGTKHWMPMMPFFALFAAAVVVAACRELAHVRRWGQRLVPVLLALVVLLPAFETYRTERDGQTYFNELILGHQGGAALGMPRTFWGGYGVRLLPLINERARPGAGVYTHRMNYDDFAAYQRNGLLRTDLRFVSELRQADYALTYHQREYQDAEYRVWAFTGDRRPLASVTFDGVATVSLYELRPKAEVRR